MTHLTETQRIEILILIGCGDKTTGCPKIRGTTQWGIVNSC
jgi:hypothetical protein